MDIRENISLSSYSTMRLGGPARYLLEIHQVDEIKPALAWAEKKGCQTIMIGIGSNIVWTDSGFNGLVLVNKISGFEVTENNSQVIAEIGAGENWDEMVAKIVELGLSGVEQLSLIPGTTGATPVQNVGAYGREMAEVLTTVEAYDTRAGKFIVITNKDCGFTYRKSRFNQEDKGRFLITSITLKLAREWSTAPFYSSLQKYFDSHGITQYSPENIRKAVISIRNSKLPDPAKIANNGSFFANPIINSDDSKELLLQFPDLPNWKMPDGKIKLSAAWMLESLGFKGYHDEKTGMAIWDKHALVLVNENAKKTADLLEFRDDIINKAKSKFGITLKQEPELI